MLIKQVALVGAAFFFLLIAGAGCATKPSVESAKKARATGPEFGQWRGQGSASRVVTKDGVSKNENWSVTLDVISKTPGFGRIEVTGAMGVYGGTIAWNKKETKILLPGQRKFVVAPNSNRAFLAILPFQISPSEVEAILFDRDFNMRALASRRIQCREDAGKETCTSDSGFSLERSRGNEMVAFEVSTDDGANVKMQFKPIKSKVQERDELWALEAPRGFKIIQQ